MIAIIDYGVGNIQNVKNAFARLGIDAIVTSNPKVILSASGAVLPGVGAFKDAMDSLVQSGLDKTVKQRVAANMPTIGICLGMQLMCEVSYEDGETKGLGIFKGKIKKLEVPYKVPHMGWNQLENKKEDPLLKDLEDPAYAYFVHSYYLTDYAESDILQTADYGVDVPATIRKDNIFGMQFHPEKSGSAGETLLKNFVEIMKAETA
jgi:glutamine amidotransferase